MKNVILINNRSLQFYDFEEIKNNYKLRITAVVFQDYYNILSEKMINSLDHIHILPNKISFYGAFQPFSEVDLQLIVEAELKKFKNTWIVGADEINSLTVARLRKKYSLRGSSEDIINKYKNKYIQKTILNNFEIRIPKFLNLENNINNINQYNYLKYYLNNSFIIKPNDMCASIGVEKISTYHEFKNYLIKFRNFSTLIAEEFIDGQLYHCDFIIQNNRYIFTEVCEYLHNGLSFINGYNHGSLILLKNDILRKSIIKFCQKANQVLGLQSGCGHFEVFVTKQQEIIFLEAGARPAGSFVPYVLNKMFSNNYLNSALLAEIEEIPKEFNIPKKYYFWAFFPKKKGIVKNLKIPPLQSSHKISWFVNIGDVMDEPSSLSEKSGLIIVENQDYDILKKDFYSLRNFEVLELE